MERMFESVAEEFVGDVHSRALYTTEPEANLVERLEAVQSRFDVTVGCYPDREAEHNRLKLTGEDEAALADATAWLRKRVDTTE